MKLEPSVRVIAICGKNARLKADLCGRAQAHPGRLKRLRLRVDHAPTDGRCQRGGYKMGPG